MVLRFAARIVLAGALALAPIIAPAQGLLRDPEIEATLKRLAAPLLKAAGLPQGSIDILIVNDQSLNAFVFDNKAIFLNSGLLMRLDGPAQIQAVIGHELGHITSGHLIRRKLNRQSATTAMGLGLLIGMAAAASGANSQASQAIILGSQAAALSNFLAHTRAEETTADQSAIRYMARAGIDGAAALDVMEIFRGQEVLSASRRDAYTRTHPLSSERIRAMKGQIAAYQGKARKPSPDMVYWHGRMVAKFRGFIGNPSANLRRVKAKDKSEAAMMIRAISNHRMGKRDKAVAYMNQLLAKRPNDPFYHELKGQILLEGRKAGAAVAAYRRAAALAPRDALILAGLGRALLAQSSKSSDREALAVLKKARARDPRDARMLRDLAVAYAKAGNNGMAALMAAERYALLSRFKDAYTSAKRAEGLLPRGSSGWLLAQDIIGQTKSYAKKK